MSTSGVPSNTYTKHYVKVARATGRGCLTRSEPPVRLGQLAPLVSCQCRSGDNRPIGPIFARVPSISRTVTGCSPSRRSLERRRINDQLLYLSVFGASEATRLRQPAFA